MPGFENARPSRKFLKITPKDDVDHRQRGDVKAVGLVARRRYVGKRCIRRIKSKTSIFGKITNRGEALKLIGLNRVLCHYPNRFVITRTTVW